MNIHVTYKNKNKNARSIQVKNKYINKMTHPLILSQEETSGGFFFFPSILPEHFLFNFSTELHPETNEAGILVSNASLR